jgi:pimeloyl-ACP methyl ester carboxylesterase
MFKKYFYTTKISLDLNSINSLSSGVFENHRTRLQYAVFGKGNKPFLFFTGFGENPLIYKRFIKHLPSDLFLIVVKSPIEFKNNSMELEEAVMDLLLYYKLPLEIRIGGFSFGNWIAMSLLCSKKISIRACIVISAPSVNNYRLFQILNRNKSLNFLIKGMLKSDLLFAHLAGFVNRFSIPKFKEKQLHAMVKKSDFKSNINHYLNTPCIDKTLHSILIQANNLAIPFLLLKSSHDPVTPSNSFYKLAHKHVKKLVLSLINSKQHSAFIKEFMEELGAFLAGV